MAIYIIDSLSTCRSRNGLKERDPPRRGRDSSSCSSFQSDLADPRRKGGSSDPSPPLVSPPDPAPKQGRGLGTRLTLLFLYCTAVSTQVWIEHKAQNDNFSEHLSKRQTVMIISRCLQLQLMYQQIPWSLHLALHQPMI